MACRSCVRALSCGMVAVMDENINENERTIHESLAGVRENVLKLIMSPETPISEWTDESLIVLRAMELANTHRCDILVGVSPDYVAPILSVSDWAYNNGSYVGHPDDAGEVAALMEFAGGIIDEGISHSRMFAPIGACIRFPDNELVRKMARKKGSVAQAELDRREDEERQRRW